MFNTGIPKLIKKSRVEWANSDAIRDEGLTEPQSIVQYKNLSYGEYGQDNLLDIYKPADSSDKILPILINIHGGGYFYGDKELYRFYAMDMSRYGFAVVNINYRLSPENKFPAALTDINNAVKYVKEHAKEYGMDLDRMFMMGDSAGAQLVSHYSAIMTNPQFASYYDFVPVDVKIKGISLACGMYDIPNEMKSQDNKWLFDCYLGENFDSSLPMLNVCKAVTKDFPTTYIFSCPNDFLYERCAPMAELINERGSKAVMKIYGTKEMTEVGHVFHCNMKLPIGEEARKDQASFMLNL